MLGDNRDNSTDSRYFGFFPRRRIVGRATADVISLDIHHGCRPRWQRFFSSLLGVCSRSDAKLLAVRSTANKIFTVCACLRVSAVEIAVFQNRQ